MSAEILSPPPDYVGPESHPSDTIKANSRSVEEVHGKLIAYLKTTARDTIIDDILTLSGIITSIEDDFAIVASRLTALDEKDIVSVKFAPEWKKLHDEYTTLMRESQRGANDVSDKIDALVKDLVPVLQMPIPLSDRKGMLTEYIESLQPFQLKAEESSNRFLRLGQAVTDFKNSLKSKVESEKEEVDKKFEEIEKNIAKLESSLEKLSRAVKNGFKSVKMALFGGNAKLEEVAGITTLTDIAPTVGKEMMEIALRYINSDLADDLKKLQQGTDVASTEKALSNLKFLRAQRGQINAEFSEVLQGLVDLDPTFAGMTNKISKIQGIWLMLLKDSQTLLNKLSDMNNTKYEAVFNQFATTLTLTYETLQFSLGRYSMAVSKPT